MPFEPFQRPRGAVVVHDPAMRISPDGKSISFNKPATAMLNGATYVKFLFDETLRQLAVEPSEQLDDFSYKISYQNGRGIIGSQAIVRFYQLAAGGYPVRMLNDRWLVADVGPAIPREDSEKQSE